MPKKMSTKIDIHPSLLGIAVNGDLGPVTIYTDREANKIAFPRSPPTSPPTARQVNQRERVRLANSQWKALSNEEKRRWENAARATSLPMTGFNAYVSLALCPDKGTFSTLNRQSGQNLTEPTPIPR